MRTLAIVASVVLAGCAGAPDGCDGGEPVCFDDATCIEGCAVSYRGIRGIAWFGGELDLERGLEALELAGHRDARIRDDGTGLVAANLTVEPLGPGAWWYVRTFAEEPVADLSAAEVAQRSEARWKLLEGGFRNGVLRFHGAYEAVPERVGWGPLTPP